jgi:CMP-N,N'-diacetyllegionaminic acid synthase
MLRGKRVLAVVPARSSSKGIPDKNMKRLAGTSLIGLAGRTLSHLNFVDLRIISTDSAEYAREGERHGLEAPFLRPPHLSSDSAGVVETLQHALTSMETSTGQKFDIVLIIEPTSPLRVPQDIEAAARRLVDSQADSVVTVSPLSTKCHPLKVLKIVNDNLTFYLGEGRSIVRRQELETLYWRNGVCYALTRACLMDQALIFGTKCIAEITQHPVVNIDEAWELDWAEFLLRRKAVNLV